MIHADYVTKSGAGATPWQVHSEAGAVLGSYPTEAAANERLRQIEAAKAAKGDGGVRVTRSDTGRVSRRDVGRLDKFERTPSGGLIIPADLTRVGVLVYQKDGKPFRELRPIDEVFSVDSYKSLEGAPVTDLHPDDGETLVDPTNWKDLARGATSCVQADRSKISAMVSVLDASLIRKVETGEASEVSCGYTCTLDMTPGVFDGQSYDAVQRDIRYNHVALGPKGWGRAGPDVALRVDGGAQGDRTMERKIKIDGIEYVVGSDSHLQAVEAQVSKLTGQVTTLTAEVATQRGRADGAETKVKATEADLVKAKADAKDAASDKEIDKRVQDRIGLIDRARRVLGADYEHAGKADTDIMRDALKKGGIEVDKDADAGYMRGAFDAVTTSSGGNADDPDKDFVGADGDAAAKADAAGRKTTTDGKRTGVRLTVADRAAPPDGSEEAVLGKVLEANAKHADGAKSRFRFSKSK